MSIELTRAEPFAAPIVERLSVRVIVDSSYDRFISDASHPMVAIEHSLRLATAGKSPGTISSWSARARTRRTP